jgi:hypothetical protein
MDKHFEPCHCYDGLDLFDSDHPLILATRKQIVFGVILAAGLISLGAYFYARHKKHSHGNPNPVNRSTD